MRCLLLICVIAFLQLAQGLQIREYLKQHTCRRAPPANFTQCVHKSLLELGPTIVKGIKELNLPPLDPFELPFLGANRTLGKLVSVRAIHRNIKTYGATDTVLEHVKADPYEMYGEIKLRFPYLYLTMDYEVDGQLLAIPLQSKAYFAGNFTDTQIFVKGSVKLVEKDNKKFYRVDKLNSKIVLGNGFIKLIEKDPNLQFSADLISNFFNKNPRGFINAVYPIFAESVNELYRVLIDQVLSSLPASEFLPE